MSESVSDVKQVNTPTLVDCELFEVDHLDRFMAELRCIAVLSDEVCLEFKESSFKVRLMDASHIAMINAEWPDNYFSTWTYGLHVKVCFSLKELLKVLGKVSKRAYAKFYLNQTKNTLDLTIFDGIKRSLTIPLLEPIEEDMPMPKIFFKTKARVITGDFKQAIKACDKVSEHVKLLIKPKCLSVSSSGDMGVVSIDLDDSMSLIEGWAEEQTEYLATYTLSYLKEMVKPLDKIAPTITIELDTDMPLRITPELDKVKIEYFLAPCTGI